MIDWASMDDEELAVALREGEAEQRRRFTLGTTQVKVDDLIRAYRSASGVVEGQPWVQPQGAHDAYPLGWVVSHNGQSWESLVHGNVWEPGVSGWRVKGGDEEWPQWVAPTGGHDAYPLGARVTHLDLRWVSNADANVWEPGVWGWDEAPGD